MVFCSVPFVFVGRCCGFAENKVAVCLFFISSFVCFFYLFLRCFSGLCLLSLSGGSGRITCFFCSVEVCYNFQAVLLVFCLLSFLVVFEIFRLWFFSSVCSFCLVAVLLKIRSMLVYFLFCIQAMVLFFCLCLVFLFGWLRSG